MNYVKVEKQELVASIILDRPPANALSSEVLAEISAILDELEEDQSVRVIVIRGEGKFFCAGADIKEFTTVKTGNEFSELATRGQNLFERIERFPKPIIASIHGAALGGGLELAMCCHVRLVSESAKLGLPELQLGLIPGFAGTQRLPFYVGTGKAYEMLLSSEPISGMEAFKFGLANHAYLEEELLEKTYEMAKKFAKKSPVSVKMAIDLLNYSKGDSFQKGVEKEAEYFGKVFESEDGKEGINAFIEKRQPEFKGR